MKTKDLIASLEAEIKREGATADTNAALLRLKEIAKEYDGDDRVISSRELVDEALKTPQKPKFYSGLDTLDKLMEGFTTGESIFFTGITKHGKTSMCMELSVRFKEQNPLWLSFEEKPIDLIRKFRDKTGDFPHFFTPRQNERPDLEWLEKKIVEAKAKYDTKVVFIDHLGFVSDAEKGKDDTEASRLERISRSVHSMAVKWEVCIFLLGHLTKVSPTQTPDLENIKGSSAMAQEADCTMMVWRRTKRENGKIVIGNETNLSIQANRRGSPGNVEMLYEAGRFTESPFQENEPDEDDVWKSKA